MATFTPGVNPDYGSTSDIEPRVLVAQFGDGYAQRTKDGINNLKRRVRLVWTLLPTSTANDIVDFFADKAGATQFQYAWPIGSSSRNWVTVGTIARTHTDYGLDSLEVEIEEAF